MKHNNEKSIVYF